MTMALNGTRLPFDLRKINWKAPEVAQAAAMTVGVAK
jgi:hypothetical protein